MNEDLELIRGSGNVFRDVWHRRNYVAQLKSILAAAIIGELDDRKLSVRKAEGVTGINASEFSRIRTAQLGRFTVDRLMTILNRLNRHVDVQVTTRPFAAGEAASALGAE